MTSFFSFFQNLISKINVIQKKLFLDKLTKMLFKKDFTGFFMTRNFKFVTELALLKITVQRVETACTLNRIQFCHMTHSCGFSCNSFSKFKNSLKNRPLKFINKTFTCQNFLKNNLSK